MIVVSAPEGGLFQGFVASMSTFCGKLDTKEDLTTIKSHKNRAKAPSLPQLDTDTNTDATTVQLVYFEVKDIHKKKGKSNQQQSHAGC